MNTPPALTPVNLDDTAGITPVLPLAFQAHIDSAPQAKGESGVLGVGMPAKVGVLQGMITPDEAGKTQFQRGLVKAPFHLMLPLYINPNNAEHAVVYTQSTGGGISQNDRLFQEYVARSGTRVTITTQAASNVHRMNEGFASSTLRAYVSDNSRTEFLPGHTTLFEGSRFVQRQEFTLEPGARLISSDILAQGRLAGGEKNSFDVAAVTTAVTLATDQDFTPLVLDTIILEGHQDTTSVLGQSDYGAWLNYYALAPASDNPGEESVDIKKLEEDILAALENTVPQHTGQDSATPVGVSILPNNTGVLVRAGMYSIADAKAVQDVVHKVAHHALFEEPAFSLRKG